MSDIKVGAAGNHVTNRDGHLFESYLRLPLSQELDAPIGSIAYSEVDGGIYKLTGNGWEKVEATGPAGADGLSAYEIAVANGFVGTEAQWLSYLKGSPVPRLIAFDALYFITGNNFASRSAPIPAAYYQQVLSQETLAAVGGFGGNGMAGVKAAAGGNNTPSLVAIPVAGSPKNVDVHFDVRFAGNANGVLGAFVGESAASGKRIFAGIVNGTPQMYDYTGDGVNATQIGPDGMPPALGEHHCVFKVRSYAGGVSFYSLEIDGKVVCPPFPARLPSGIISTIGLQIISAGGATATNGASFFGNFYAYDLDIVPTNALVAVKGDSTMEGDGTTAYGPAGAYSPPSVLTASLPGYDVVNLGRGGQALGFRRDDAILPSMLTATGNGELDLLYNPSRSRNILVLQGGINDRYVWNAAPASFIYGSMMAVIRGLKNPWEVYLCTVTPVIAASFGNDFNAVRAQVNTLIRSGAATGGYKVVDFDANPNIGADDAPNNPTYYNPDKIHPTNAGAAIQGQIIHDAIMA